MKLIISAVLILYICVLDCNAQILNPGTCALPNIIPVGNQPAFTTVNLTGFSTRVYGTGTWPIDASCHQSAIALISWFEFTGSGHDILLQIKYVRGLTQAMTVVVSDGACGSLQRIICFNERQVRSGTTQLVLPALATGVRYTLNVLGMENNPAYEISLHNLPVNSRPKLVLSTRGPIRWNSAERWVGGIIPMPGDSVIIDDSADTNVPVRLLTDAPFKLSYLQIGRGLSNHFTALTGTLLEDGSRGHIEVSGDVVARATSISLLNTQIETRGNFRYYGDFTGNENNGARIIFTGSGTRLITRVTGNSTQENRLSFSIRNPNCTLQFANTYYSISGLDLDSGYISSNNNYFIARNSTAYSSASQSYSFPYIKRVMGEWIGTVPRLVCPTCTTMSYYYGSPTLPLDSIRVGNEWVQSIPLRVLQASYVRRLNLPRVPFFRFTPRPNNSFILLNQDTVYHDAFSYPYSVNEVGENVPSGLSPLLWSARIGSVAAANLGLLFNSPNGIRHAYIRTTGPSTWNMRVHDQAPSTLAATFTGDLTALRGKNYLQLANTGAPQDSITVTLVVHPTDSIQDSRWDLCLAQAPTPNGPWKAVSKRDSVSANRHLRGARVRLTDGLYFALGSRQLERNVKLRDLLLPAGYQMACANSFGLPLSLVVENLGSQPIDSIEVGFQTPSQLFNTIVRLDRPLRSLGVDTLVLEGPQGLDVLTTSTQPIKAWVGYPGAGNLFDDTIKTVVRVVSPSLPYQETFDTTKTTVSNFWRSRNLSPVAGWHVYYNSANSAPSEFSTQMGYFTRSGGSGTNRVFRTDFNHPIQSRMATPGFSLSPGRWYIGYTLRLTGSTGFSADTVRLEYTTDCGVNWRILNKRSAPDVITCCNRGQLNNSITQVEQLDLVGNERVSFRFVIDNSHRYISDLDIVQVSSNLITSIPETAISDNAELRPWYPNPSHGELHYRGKAGLAIITNAAGKVVYQQQVNTNEVLDTRNWSPGLYFIRVGESRWKVVVQ